MTVNIDEKIKKVLECAIAAPSGDNCQPWKFRAEGRTVWLYNVPERDTSLYNYKQNASMVAHGAFLENVKIASPSFGLRAKMALFPDPEETDLVARIDFEDGSGELDPLFDAITERATNRKKYLGENLTKEQIARLKTAADSISDTKIYLATERDKVRNLSGVLSQNDRLVFENYYLHQFLFDHIRWNEAETRRSRDGLDIRTLELSSFDSLGFRLLKNWPLVNFFNKFGLSKKIRRQAEDLCLTADAIGAITVSGRERKDFLRGGQAMQRFWLEGTKEGLSMQPLAGIGFLIQRVKDSFSEKMSDSDEEVVLNVMQKFKEAFPGLESDIVMLFRIGKSSPPTVSSLRMPLSDLLQ